MLLGTAAIDITPRVGTPLAGALEPRTSIGVDDPLMCKAMVLGNEAETRIALVTLDLIAWTRSRCDEPRAVIAAQTGIPPEHVLINCSHTHSGPYTDESLDLSGALDEAYLAKVRDAISEAVRQAAGDLLPVAVGTAKTTLGGIGRNRRLLRQDGSAINVWLASDEERASLPLAGPNDEDLLAWVFFHEGSPVATLWNYTMHVNAHFGTSFSADYPGRVAASLRDEFGPGFFSLFLPGTCGDINNVVGFEEAHQRLSQAMRELVRRATPGDSEALTAAWREVRLGVRDREPFQEAEIRDKWPGGFDVFQNEDRLLTADPQDDVLTVVQALRIGDAAVAATPGETFAQIGLDIKQRSPYGMTAVAELCNDIVGYIPTVEGFQQGGYETFRSRWARVSPGSGEKLAGELVDMLAQLSSTRAGAARRGVEFVGVDGKAGWPVLLPDGRLMVWWTEGKGEDPAQVADPSIAQRFCCRFSSDDGRTWSEPHVAFQFAPERSAFLSPGAVLLDRDGVVHCFGLRYQAFVVDDWDATRSALFHVMSADGGQTWTSPRDCDFGAQYTGASNCAIQLGSGRILAPVSYYSKRATARFVSRITLSDDGGKTWRPSKGECVVDTGGGAPESGACEPVALQLTDGRVWMLLRTQAGTQYESWSSDDGDTWTEPAPSRFVSSNAPVHMARLRDGRIALVWQNCMGPAGVSYDRQILAAAISDDDGGTWRGYREIVRAGERGAAEQVTYPWVCEAADGKLLVSYFGAKGPWDVGLLRLDPQWLYETTRHEELTRGLGDWVTMGMEGADVMPHPAREGRRVLGIRKPKPDVEAGASLNFPFGAKGRLAVRLCLQPGFQGTRLSLADHFSLPAQREDGLFGLLIAPTGQLGVMTAPDTITPIPVSLEADEWHTLDFAWDCRKGTCKLAVDEKPVAGLPQLVKGVGVCYLRLWSAAGKTDGAGLLIESVDTQAKSW